jgi:hypothetical protein
MGPAAAAGTRTAWRRAYSVWATDARSVGLTTTAQAGQEHLSALPAACASPARRARNSVRCCSPRYVAPQANGKIPGRRVRPYAMAVAAPPASQAPCNATGCSRRPATPAVPGRTSEAHAPISAPTPPEPAPPASQAPCNATGCSRRPATPAAPGRTAEPPVPISATMPQAHVWVPARPGQSSAAVPSRRPATRAECGRAPGMRVPGALPVRWRRELVRKRQELAQLRTSATAPASATRRPGSARIPRRTARPVTTATPALNTIPAMPACVRGRW